MARILLVDDQRDVAETVAAMLRAGGHVVVMGTPGIGIWVELEDVAIEAVVTDLNLPVANGRDIALWLRRHRPEVPVVGMSGRPDLLAEMARQGVFTVTMPKPFRRSQLLDGVNRALRRRAIG